MCLVIRIYKLTITELTKTLLCLLYYKSYNKQSTNQDQSTSTNQSPPINNRIVS